jgi:hypothetical protein
MTDEYGIERRPELPGRPRKKLVKDVRSVLWRYLRCRPQRADRTWRMAWAWAEACGRRDAMWTKYSCKWPAANEIASQYLLLVLADMREMRALRLPWRAAECVPPAVVELLGGPALPRLHYNSSAQEPSDAIQ